MADDLRAGLIMRALGARRLHGFLPGQDNRAAIAEAARTCMPWIHDGLRGHATRNGLGEWPAGARGRTRGEAAVYLSWREVLDVVGRGCRDGGLEAYEAAWRAFEARARKAGPDGADPAALAGSAWQLVRRGCARPVRAQAMQTLF